MRGESGNLRFSGLESGSSEVTSLSNVSNGLVLVGRLLSVSSSFLSLISSSSDDAAKKRVGITSERSGELRAADRTRTHSDTAWRT